MPPSTRAQPFRVSLIGWVDITVLGSSTMPVNVRMPDKCSSWFSTGLVVEPIDEEVAAKRGSDAELRIMRGGDAAIVTPEVPKWANAA
mmetsp:Transcript_9183/g.23577  ORF Transcript_9183/g.23577 Transcript_9183/m.23577 type:complete len:88 (+) Transcript_9183:426-689(+)